MISSGPDVQGLAPESEHLMDSLSPGGLGLAAVKWRSGVCVCGRIVRYRWDKSPAPTGFGKAGWGGLCAFGGSARPPKTFTDCFCPGLILVKDGTLRRSFNGPRVFQEGNGIAYGADPSQSPVTSPKTTGIWAAPVHFLQQEWPAWPPIAPPTPGRFFCLFSAGSEFAAVRSDAQGIQIENFDAVAFDFNDSPPGQVFKDPREGLGFYREA